MRKILPILNDSYRAVIFQSKDYCNREEILLLEVKRLGGRDGIVIKDTIEGQLKELVKCHYPRIKFKENPDLLDKKVSEFLHGRSAAEIGNWIYYPWLNTLVHLLGKDDFYTVRTNRNQYKITSEQQKELGKKKVGVIGLSVGNAVAITMAMERIFGEIRLADYDEIEVSNLNRIRCGVQNLGINKAIATAREIAEIDPYLNVKVYEGGITHENIDQFFIEGGKLDLLVEECDGLDIKIIARNRAKELGIPVVMETNDRAMLDIERFDLEPDRPILHGLVKNLDVDLLKTLKTNEEKVPYMLDMIGIEDTSVLLRASMLEIEQTITTWPQLGSSVVFGGGLVTSVARRILLGSEVLSGRYYNDFEEVGERIKDNTNLYSDAENIPELTVEKMIEIAGMHLPEVPSSIAMNSVKQLVEAAHKAPSGGNMQPWKWLWEKGRLFMFVDFSLSNSFLDFDHLGTMVGFGAATQNILEESAKRGIKAEFKFKYNNRNLVGFFDFTENEKIRDSECLAEFIDQRGCNRTLGKMLPIPEETYLKLEKICTTIEGARLSWVEGSEIIELGKVLSAIERIRLLTQRGHSDFVKEIRWTTKEAEETKDGIDLRTIDITETERAGLVVSRDSKVAEYLRKNKLGTGMETLMTKAIKEADRIGFITMPYGGHKGYFEGGRALERVWLKATQLNLGFHPISPSTFIFSRYVSSNNDPELQEFSEELKHLREQFKRLLNIEGGVGEIFLFRLFKGNDIRVRSLRRNINQHFFVKN
ncbi:MAG: Rv1355c family protein [Flavobacteriales bacterium]|nr:Rv1355c family protein [Flavobacteriales bacterium]